MNDKYVICRKEINNKETILCQQSMEESELFKLIAMNEEYIIYKNNEDVTEKYK